MSHDGRLRFRLGRSLGGWLLPLAGLVSLGLAGCGDKENHW